MGREKRELTARMQVDPSQSDIEIRAEMAVQLRLYSAH